ncbi:hypothetical protein L7F22_064850 [Adiantum nelumboides]|nr:hypothetical protein [Adiantum nelumboides]
MMGAILSLRKAKAKWVDSLVRGREQGKEGVGEFETSSRHLAPIPRDARSRVEALLASFPKLISTGSQHTTIETDTVRYVYQPLEDLYMILITNKSSNILQDIDTLHLFARTVSDMCRSLDERDVLRNSFELLGAFDEIVSLGYRENVGLAQIKTFLEMESQEEKIQEIIERNKELEAQEELKRRAKQLEMQRREAARRGQMAYSGNSGGFGASGGYQGVRQFEGATNTAPVVRDTGATPSSAPVKPAFKSKGMQLGKKSKTANLFGAEAEDEEPLPAQAAAPVSRAAPAAAAAAASSTATASATTRPSSKTVDPIDLLPPVTQEGVHLVVKERISLQATRDGSLESLEVKGDLELRITDPTLSKVAVQVTPASTSSLLPASALQFKTHPHVDKAAWADGRLIKLRDANKPFPVRQNLGVLRWRATTKDETVVPLSVQCWPSPAEDGSGACDVMIEFELENKALQLQNVVIAVPLPPASRRRSARTQSTGRSTSATAPSNGTSKPSRRRPASRAASSRSSIKRYVEEYQKRTANSASIETVADMKRFVEAYPEFRKLGGNVSKHVALLGELSRRVESDRLLEVSELEQSLASNESHASDLRNVYRLLDLPDVKPDAKLRLACLYALRYQKYSGNQINQIVAKLLDAGMPESRAALVFVLLNIAGADQRQDDLFANENFFSRGKSALKGLKGVENVYTQHSPHLVETIEDLLRGRLKETSYPFIGPGGTGAAGGLHQKPQDVIIFVVGGATYEGLCAGALPFTGISLMTILVALYRGTHNRPPQRTARPQRRLGHRHTTVNASGAASGLAGGGLGGASGPSTRFLLGGTCIHSSSSFLDMIQDVASRLPSSFARPPPTSNNAASAASQPSLNLSIGPSSSTSAAGRQASPASREASWIPEGWARLPREPEILPEASLGESGAPWTVCHEMQFLSLL